MDILYIAEKHTNQFCSIDSWEKMLLRIKFLDSVGTRDHRVQMENKMYTIAVTSGNDQNFNQDPDLQRT